MIRDSDISIVVQGPIIYNSAKNVTSETTKLVCERIRRLFPESELILSTWEGSDVTGIPFDKVIFNSDPGATWFNYQNYKLLNNCSRLIVSTRSGIEVASRKYVLKIRSDLFVISKSFLKYFYKFPHFDIKYKSVKNRIIAFSLYSIKGHKTKLFTMKRPYHISDWAYFGYKEDLFDLYNIPLPKEPQFSQWFSKRCKPFFDIEPDRLWKMPPEQYVTTQFLQKHFNINFDYTTDLSNDNEITSECLLANNFLVLDQTQFQLISLKYLNLQLLFDSLLSRTAIFYATWLEDYYKYFDLSRNANYYLYMIYVNWRKITYYIFNIVLRLINGKKQKISQLLALLIKFYTRKWACLTERADLKNL